MTIMRTALVTALTGCGLTCAASAAPTGHVSALATPAPVTLAAYGYGPLRYGLYGHRRRHWSRRSYGTGYHGRGTRTGGPVGGLPSRN